MVKQAPNNKHQIPDKLQAPNSEHFKIDETLRTQDLPQNAHKAKR
jgi:hypothetical protein